MNLTYHPVFPSLIVETQLPLFEDVRENLENFLLSYQKNTPGVQNSNYGGYQSDDSFWKDESFSEYFEYFDNHIKMIILKVFNTELNLDNAWFNINSKGNFNSLHNHPGSYVSCIVWVKIPENSGVLRFANYPVMVSNTNLYSSLDENILESYNMREDYQFNPKPGNLILFPSYMHHDVTPNVNDDDRISLAFNYN